LTDGEAEDSTDLQIYRMDSMKTTKQREAAKMILSTVQALLYPMVKTGDSKELQTCTRRVREVVKTDFDAGTSVKSILIAK
jgi:hypothetical protein